MFVPIDAICALHLGARARADGHHRDDRADADDDAERGQQRAQLVAQERAHRDLTSLRASMTAHGAARCASRRLRARRSSRLDVAVADDDDALGVGRDVGLVRDEDDRDAALVVEAAGRAP